MPEAASDPIGVELDRARTRVASIAGQTVPAITIDPLTPADASFLGANISKLSPFVSNLIERSILQDLATTPGEHGYNWYRQDPGFPDAGIYNPKGEFTGHGIEVKAWYALATEITGRFKVSQLHLEGRQIDVALVSWVMSDVVAGQPLIVDVALIDALSIAKARDAHYHKPPRYLVEQPVDTSTRGVQLQQVNVNGYLIQTTSPKDLEKAALSTKAYGSTPVPHDPMTRQLVEELMGRYPYRLETNFAKIDRIDHPQIEKFKAKTLGTKHRGHTLDEWRTILRDLDREPGPAQDTAVAAVAALYA